MALFYQHLGNFTKIKQKQTHHLPIGFSATYKCLHSYLHLKCFICQLQLAFANADQLWERCWLLLLPPFRCGSYWTLPAQTCRQQTYGLVDSLWNNLLGVLQVFQKSHGQRCTIFNITFIWNAKVKIFICSLVLLRFITIAQREIDCGLN